MFVVRGLFLSTLLAAFFVSTAHAVPINYGDFAGSSVVYHSVSEDSNSGDVPPFYFLPEILPGNTLDFDPLAFAASSAGGAAADTTRGLLTMVVTANAGFAVQSVSVYAAGDFTVAGTGTSLTSATTLTQFNINVTEVDGVAIAPFSVAGPIPASPSGGEYLLSNGTVILNPWSASGVVDLQAVLAGLAIPFNLGVTKFSVEFTETMKAASQQTSVAFIATKDFYIQSNTIRAVPEPASCLLLGLGLAGLGARARRKA